MTPDLHWFMANPSDLDEDPWDTPAEQAKADLQAELAAEAREYEWIERRET